MANLLDISGDKTTPIELMGAILRARAELMWFGGIGTYVKSNEETDYEVGDRTNDAIRINGADLRTKVVGEGANLGLTQRGRIEFARNGGRINMDAIDNAAGVDCSDHEVNIKILVDAALADGRIEPGDRKAFLESMTDVVSELVLKNHYDQSLGLTIAEGTSQLDRDSDGRLMRALERLGRLNRELEFLPGEERLEDLADSGQGLSRPELAILMSYTKATLFDALLASDLPEDPFLESYLLAYFPKHLQDKFPDLIAKHRLRREIIATELANEIVDTGGITFVHRLVELSGASVAEVARAFVVTMVLYKIDDIRDQIHALDNIVSAEIQTEMHLAIHYLLRHQMSWFLSLGRLDEIGATIERYEAGIRAVRDAPRSVVIGVEVSAIDERVKHLTEAGVNHELASTIATLKPMIAAGDIVDLSDCSKLPIDQVASAYFLMGAELRLDRLHETAGVLSAGEHYDRLAIKRIASDLGHYQRMVSEHALMSRQEATGNERVRAWLQENHAQVGRFRQLFGELEAAGGLNIAKLSLLASQMHDLVQSLRTP
jgi:glutamate dehydrogenase